MEDSVLPKTRERQIVEEDIIADDFILRLMKGDGEEKVEGGKVKRVRHKRAAMRRDMQMLWPHGIIPYAFSRNFTRSKCPGFPLYFRSMVWARLLLP